MDSVMKYGLGFFSLCVISAAMVASPALGNTASLFTQADDGTYRTVPGAGEETCAALCKSEAEVCRGWVIQTITTIPDTRYPHESYDETICQLNNGKGEQPVFPSTPPEPLDMARAVSDLNDYRAQYNLGPVNINPKLNRASEAHAEDLAQAGIISHTGTDGSSHADRVQRQGYYFTIAAENVATGQKSWDKVFDAWQKSPGHNENLLRNDVTEFGIALVYNPDVRYETFWAMLVASPMDESAGLVYR